MKRELKSIQEAEQLLQSYIPNANKYIADGLSLDRMWPLLEAAGNPHQKLKVVHIAGTSGKTSTTYYVASLLAASGKTVGHTVSPHVQSITERVQINCQPVTDAEFCSLLSEFLGVVDEESNPSYFELLMVFVLWVFVKKGVDYAVLETGLGGILDSTNVVTREDKVCIITDIGLDHTQILGKTVDAIASQKAGIMHKNNVCFTRNQDEQILAELNKRSEEVGAQLHVVEDYDEGKYEDLPEFQKRNFDIAHEAYKYIAQRDRFSVDSDFDPSNVSVPGRMEELDFSEDQKIIIDGAHNGQKVSTFVDSFMRKHPNQKVPVMLALKEGKEYIDVIDALKPIASNLVLTTFIAVQDFRNTSQNPFELAVYAHEKAGIPSVVIKDPERALNHLKHCPGRLKVVIGSFYLLGVIRKFI